MKKLVVFLLTLVCFRASANMILTILKQSQQEKTTYGQLLMFVADPQNKKDFAQYLTQHKLMNEPIEKLVVNGSKVVLLSDKKIEIDFAQNKKGFITLNGFKVDLTKKRSLNESLVMIDKILNLKTSRYSLMLDDAFAQGLFDRAKATLAMVFEKGAWYHAISKEKDADYIAMAMFQMFMYNKSVDEKHKIYPMIAPIRCENKHLMDINFIDVQIDTKTPVAKNQKLFQITDVDKVDFSFEKNKTCQFTFKDAQIKSAKALIAANEGYCKNFVNQNIPFPISDFESCCKSATCPEKYNKFAEDFRKSPKEPPASAVGTR